MGGQQSTRRLTVINDEATGSIKITDSVAQRIVTEIEQSSKAQPQPPVVEAVSPPPPPASMPEAPKVADPEPPAAPVDPPSASAAAPIPQQKPVIQYVEKEPSMTSLRIKAEKEKELSEAENYWRKRFAKQEREHTSLAHLEVAAMNETAEKLSKAFSIQRSPPICQQQRDFVLQCYKQNSDRPLMCSQTVKDFSQCVHSARMAASG